ncbi:MAG: BatD family protein [Planctomycetes bacterium]|nr:BatD family protein [Planctomycetota bacterium]
MSLAARILLVVGLGLAAGPANLRAQRIQTQVEPSRAWLGQEIRYAVKVADQRDADCTLEPVDGLSFELEGEGLTDQATRISIVNGRREVHESANYLFVYRVKAARPGRFVIPPPRVSVGGAERRGEPTVLVVDDPASDDRAVVVFRAEPPALVLGQEGKLVVEVDLLAPDAQLGARDPLDLYDQGSGFFDPGTPPPSLALPWLAAPPQGFGGIDLQAWATARQVRRGFVFPQARNARFLEGQPLDVERSDAAGHKRAYRRYRFTLPIRGEVAGRHEFAAVTLQGALVAREGQRFVWRDAFASSAPLTLEVREAPSEGRPPEFGGAIGRFTIEATPPTPNRVRVGDAVYLTVVVRGEGFLKGVDLDLAAQLGERFRVERVGITDSLPAGAERPPGFPDRAGFWRQWDFKLYPQSAGIDAIPALRFAWYDPERGAYASASTAPAPLVVEAGALDSGVVLGTASTRRDVELVATEALAANVTDLNRLGNQAATPWREFALLIALLPAYAVLAFVVTRRRRLREDPALLRRSRAASRCLARLRAARQAGGLAAIRGAHEALCGFVADHEGRDEAAMTGEDLLRWLRAAGHEPSLCAQVERLGAAVEAARYGAAGSAVELGLLDGLERIAAQRSARPSRAPVGRALALGLAMAFGGAPAGAQDLAAFNAAQAAFEAKDHARAAESLAAMLVDGYENGYVLYDLGNAQLRAGRLGHAIAAYRRASLFIPNDANLAVNLARALAARRDPLSAPATGRVLDRIAFWREQLPFRTELDVALGTGLLAFALATLRLLVLRRAPALRPLALALAAIALVFAVSALLDWQRLQAREGGVVVADAAVLRTGPGESHEARYEQPLREGAELVVQERREGWLRVLAGGQYEGWLPESAVATW